MPILATITKELNKKKENVNARDPQSSSDGSASARHAPELLKVLPQEALNC